MYENDSFFTLSVAGQIGLAVLSLTLTAALLFAFWRLTRGRNFYIKLGVSVLVLWLFTWLSPQVYYTYYLFLFDSIPVQNVIKSPPTPADLWALITFGDRANLSSHGKGVLFWLLITLSFLGRNTTSRP